MSDASVLSIDGVPPEERAERLRLQEGLPVPQNRAAGLTILKRDSLKGVLSGPVLETQFMVAAIAAVNELPPGTTPSSTVRAVFNAATLGLMFGSVRGHAYLVPYKDKKASEREGQDIYDCNLIIGYKGFQALAYRSGFLRDISTEVILQGEQFDMLGTENGKTIHHVLSITRNVEPDGKNILGAYCVYSTRTGGKGVTVVPRAELERARSVYSDIWKKHYGPMSMKSAIRRAAKEWDLTEQLAAAITLDEQAEALVPQSANYIDIDEELPERRRRLKTGKSALDDDLRQLAEDNKLPVKESGTTN